MSDNGTLNEAKEHGVAAQTTNNEYEDHCRKCNWPMLRVNVLLNPNFTIIYIHCE